MDARLTRMLDRFGRGRVRRDPGTGTLHHTGPDGVVRDHHVSAWEVGSLLQTLTMIRPQAKQAKQHRELVEGLSKGDRIVTVGGIHGTIRQVDEKTVLVEVDGGTKLRIDKGKVGYSLSSTEPA